MKRKEANLMRNLSHIEANFKVLIPSKSISDHMNSKSTLKKRNTQKYKKSKIQYSNIFNKKVSLMAIQNKCGYVAIEIYRKEHTRLFRTEMIVVSQKQTHHYCIDGFKRVLIFQYEKRKIHWISFFPSEIQWSSFSTKTWLFTLCISS